MRRAIAPKATVSAPHDENPDRPDRHHPQALELGTGQAECDLAVATQELADQEALGPDA